MNKVKEFNCHFTLPFSAELVWKHLAENYGDVANFANGVDSSEYINGSQQGGEGSERVCRIDAKGKKYLKEKMVNVDVDNMTFTNLITEVKGLPIVPRLSKVVMSVNALSSGSCEFHVVTFFRTKPAFLVRFMKNVNYKQMSDLVVGLHHYINTKEVVTKVNFKKISQLHDNINF